jgi:hypothetical protein
LIDAMSHRRVDSGWARAAAVAEGWDEGWCKRGNERVMAVEVADDDVTVGRVGGKKGEKIHNK